MSPPAIVIRLELERAPIVIADYLTDGDERRMQAWLESHPALAELVARAQELAEEANAA